MHGVVEGSALDVDVGRLLEQGHEPLGGAGDPRGGEFVVIERQSQHLEHVAGGAEPREDVGRHAGACEELRGKAAVRLLEAAGPVDRVGKPIGGGRPATGEGRIGVAPRSAMGGERQGQSREAVGPAAGARREVGIGLHPHDIFDGP